MVKHLIKKLPKNTYEIKVTVAWADVDKEYATSFESLQKELTVEGFRKGKAPKTVAEKHISKEAVYQHLVKKILPQIYEKVIKEEQLKPIISPRIELVKAKEKEDWELLVTLAEKPLIELKDYKKAVREARVATKKADIWVPGKEKEPAKEKEKSDQDNLNLVLTALLKEVKCEISDLILEEELSHRLSRLLDDIQKLGLTADAYLKSKGTTMDDLKARMKKEINDMYVIEFVLAEIAEKENITVDPKDLDALFGNIKDEKEKKAAQENAYFYASILRKQKTLEFLSNL